jgi:hypothetical protein
MSQDFHAGFRIEISGRFIGEERRIVDQRARAIATRRCRWPPESWDGS